MKVVAVLGAMAFLGLMILLIFAGSIFWIRSLAQDVGNTQLAQGVAGQQKENDQQNNQPFAEKLAENYAPFPIPKVKKQIASFELAKLYVAKYGTHLKTYSSKDPPACRMRVEMYLPNDIAADAKIPCVLIAPAGSNLLTGLECDDLTYTDEILPFIKSGMAVVHYSIDGPLPDDERLAEKFLPGSFHKFASAHGGVVNGQRALDFALENFNQIDRDKIYCAGHSSAGTLSLQLASADSRISRCIAFAPAPSLKKRFRDFMGQPGVDEALPMFKQYVGKWSPDNRANKFHCPIFIFHARDDSNTPWRDTKKFCDQLVAAGKSVKLVSADRGGHYQSMIDEGIPAAVRWLKSDAE